AYREHSGNRSIWIDNHTVSLDLEGFSVIGKPDRVDLNESDQNGSGLFIIDYKSSGHVPHGSEIVQDLYRLQLPIYAIALQRTSQKPVIGVQFVEFDRRNTRSRGIFFKPWNGSWNGEGKNCTN